METELSFIKFQFRVKYLEAQLKRNVLSQLQAIRQQQEDDLNTKQANQQLEQTVQHWSVSTLQNIKVVVDNISRYDPNLMEVKDYQLKQCECALQDLRQMLLFVASNYSIKSDFNIQIIKDRINALVKEQSSLISTLKSKIQSTQSVETFECGICKEIRFSDEIDRCCSKHKYCTYCLQKAFKDSLDDRSLIPLKCWGCVEESADNPPCFEPELYLSDDESMKKYGCIRAAKTAFTDESQSCSEVYDVEEMKNAPNPRKDCHFCGKAFCCSCRVSWHEGVDCIKFQELPADMRNESDLASFVFINNTYIKCPRCKVPVEKISGCNHMTCKCGNHFCYLCGYQAPVGQIYAHTSTCTLKR